MFKQSIQWLVLTLFMASPLAQADITGQWNTKGVLSVSHSKRNHDTIYTVSHVDETWTFNADKTFARGDLTGTWKKKRGIDLYQINYDQDTYSDHIADYWTSLGVVVSNVRIKESKFFVWEVSNGLQGEEFLKYKMDVTENGATKSVTVTIKGSSVAIDEDSENTELHEFYPTMTTNVDNNTSGGSIVTNVTVDVGGITFGTAP